MRLIDADAITSRIKHIIEAERQIFKKASWDFAEKCLTVVESTPTVEIIMCKNCNNAHYDTIFKEYWCNGKKVKPNHFCGYAERRQDES